MEYERIEAIREKLGLTKRAFARLIGVGMALYYSWSRPGKSPRGPALKLLTLLEREPGKMYCKLNRIDVNI